MTLEEAKALVGTRHHIVHDAGIGVEYGRITRVIGERVLCQMGGDPLDIITTHPEYLTQATLSGPSKDR